MKKKFKIYLTSLGISQEYLEQISDRQSLPKCRVLLQPQQDVISSPTEKRVLCRHCLKSTQVKIIELQSQLAGRGVLGFGLGVDLIISCLRSAQTKFSEAKLLRERVLDAIVPGSAVLIQSHIVFVVIKQPSQGRGYSLLLKHHLH